MQTGNGSSVSIGYNETIEGARDDIRVRFLSGRDESAKTCTNDAMHRSDKLIMVFDEGNLGWEKQNDELKEELN